jgi:antitoxin CptB
MTGSTLSSDRLDPRRKRLLYRCWHRGTRELDLIVGRFADAHLLRLSDGELDQFERILEVADPELYAALVDDGPVPRGAEGTVFEQLKSFRVADHGA